MRDSEDSEPRNAAGIAALVNCLRRYVDTYPSRFEVIEAASRKLITRTFVLGDRGITN